MRDRNKESEENEESEKIKKVKKTKKVKKMKKMKNINERQLKIIVIVRESDTFRRRSIDYIIVRVKERV